MTTQYVVLAIPDTAEARQLVQDMHRYVSEPILTPSANNPIHAIFISQGTDPPDLQTPVWAAAMQTSLDRMEGVIMATQDDIDTLTTNIAADVAEIKSSLADLEQQVANNQPVDLTRLQAAVGDLDTTASSAPQPPAPPAP